MGVPLAEIKENWIRAMNAPIEPNVVEDAPCHEIVYRDNELLNGNGLDALPVPISSPGWDNAPYTTSSHFITSDPETGVQNMGNYRGMLKAPNRIGMNPSIELRTGGYMHWEEWKKRGEPMPCAIVLGCPPVVSFTAVQKMPEKLDELWVSGGLVGKPLNVVKAKTVDLLVPAEAEVVIEGYVSTELLEPEAPFGESHGHVNLQEYNGYVDVTAITRRREAVITSWVSQVTPSESSAIKRPAYGGGADRASARPSRHQGGEARRDARAAHLAAQADRRRRRPRDAAHRGLARALRRRLAAPRRREMDHRRQRGYRPGRHQRGVLGDVLPLQAAPRRRDPQAQGRGARPAQPDRQQRTARCWSTRR